MRFVKVIEITITEETILATSIDTEITTSVILMDTETTTSVGTETAISVDTRTTILTTLMNTTAEEDSIVTKIIEIL